MGKAWELRFWEGLKKDDQDLLHEGHHGQPLTPQQAQDTRDLLISSQREIDRLRDN